MEKRKLNIDDLKKDVRNAEKYFDRTGSAAKDAYSILEEETKKTEEVESVKETIYLYIPGTAQDSFELFLN